MTPENGWITDGMIYSNGGEILSPDRRSVNFATPEVFEVFQMWQDFYNSGAYAHGSEMEQIEQFMAGNVGMHLQSTSVYSGIKNASEAAGWEVLGVEMPRFGDRPSVPVNSGAALTVRSESADESLAIWEFIKYVTGPVGYTIITSEVGYLPLNKEIADDPAYLKGFVDENPILRTNINQLARLRPITIWPGEQGTEISRVFMDMVVEAVSTTRNVEDTIRQAQDRINGMLQ